jgi:hypothetical protein
MEQLSNLVDVWLNGELREDITPVLEIDENSIGTKLHIATPEDVTLLIGVTGCGKSQVCAYLVRQFILPEEDSFFKRIKNNRPFVVYIFETEMAKQNLVKYYCKNAFYDYSMDQCKDNLNISERLYVYSLKNYSIPERKKKLIAKLNEIKKDAEKYNFVIFIDNIGSFCPDLNAGGTNEIVNEIFSALSDLTSFVVMHTNHKPNSQTKSNATGLAGSVVEKLSQNTIEIQKNESKLITMLLKKSKTQDDTLDTAINFIQEEAEGKFFIKEVVTGPVNFNNYENKTENASRVSDEEFLQRIRDHVKDKPNNSPERTIKYFKSLFPEYSDTSKSVDNKIKEFVNKKILIKEGGYIFHKDEMPFP